MIVRHGEHVIFENVEDENGNFHNLTVAQYIHYSLEADQLKFQSELYNDLLAEAARLSLDPNFKAVTYFMHHDDIRISQIATTMATDNYHLSERKDDGPLNDLDQKQRDANEQEALRNQTEHLLLDFRMDYVEHHLKDLMEQIKQAAADTERLKKLMEDYRDMQDIRNKLAKQLGNNIIV